MDKMLGFTLDQLTNVALIADRALDVTGTLEPYLHIHPMFMATSMCVDNLKQAMIAMLANRVSNNIPIDDDGAVIEEILNHVNMHWNEIEPMRLLRDEANRASKDYGAVAASQAIMPKLVPAIKETIERMKKGDDAQDVQATPSSEIPSAFLNAWGPDEQPYV